MKAIEKNLQQLGLNKSEADIYILLANNGECSIPFLVGKTNLSRTAIYNSLEILISSDLVEHIKNGHHAFYKISHPENLKKILTSKKISLQEEEIKLFSNINYLTNLYNLNNSKPGIQLFEGKEGIIKAYEELLADKQNIDSIEDMGDMQKFISDYIPKYIEKRVKFKIRNRCLAPTTNKINFSDEKLLREGKLVNAELFPFNMDIKINNKKVVLVTLKEQNAVGIIIIHPEIVKNFQTLFNYLWQASK